jgi:hypothetical protein
MALRIQVDHEGPSSHLGQTKPIRCREAALSCPTLKIEEELFPYRFDRRWNSQIGSIFDCILRLVIALLVHIPFGRRKDSLRFLLKKFLFRNSQDLRKVHWRIDDVS